MASTIPTLIAEPPRTPTPPPEAIPEVNEAVHDVKTLSPFSATFGGSMRSPGSLNSGLVSPSRNYLSPYSPTTNSSNEVSASIAGGGETERQPFNFKPMSYTVGKPPMASKQAELGRRRGHKYARSSVSHQIILSPTPRLPLQLPTSLPMPTLREVRHSMTKEQRNRWVWCGCQLSVAAYVQFQAHGSMSLTALSHLLFFDALSAILCTAVDVGRNFDVWTRTSLRNPFGLERSELIAGLAMSIILLFMGLDLISHGLTHSLENAGGHVAHHAHAHERVSPGNLDTAALAAILSTFVSATTLGNHTRIGRAISPSRLPSWIPEILRNPSHLLTLSCSFLLLVLPLLSIKIYAWFDNSLAFTIALAMIVLGGRLCYSLGCVLLMSYPAKTSSEIKDLISELERETEVTAVDEAKIWQVHYGLGMANFKLRVREQDAIDRVREKLGSLVRSRLGGANEGRGGVKWEISSMISVDRD